MDDKIKALLDEACQLLELPSMNCRVPVDKASALRQRINDVLIEEESK